MTAIARVRSVTVRSGLARVDPWLGQVLLCGGALVVWSAAGGLAHPVATAGTAAALGVSLVWGWLALERLRREIVELRAERADIEAAVGAAAEVDAVTGLSNRSGLQARLDVALADRRTETGLLVVGLDSFGSFNDVLGPRAGDRILAQAGSRLLGRLRPTDTLARLGGAEFAVLVRQPTAEGVAVLARDLLDVLASPFEIEGASLQLRARVGIAWSQGRRDVDAVLREAEVAMHSIRDAASTRVATYDASAMRRHQRLVQLRLGLHEALSRGQVEVFYQPVVHLADGRVQGMHALPVWTRHDGDVVWGEELSDLAAQAGVAAPLAGFVLRECAAQIQRWADQGYDLDLAVELEGPVLEERALRAELHAARDQVPASRRLIVLVRNTAQLLDHAAVASLFHALREEDCVLGLLCTGVPDLLELATLPLDLMALPGTLVRELGSGSGLGAVATRTVELGHQLGLELLATGVEQPGQLQGLKDAGCQLGWGSLFSRPRSAYAFDAMLRRRNVLAELP